MAPTVEEASCSELVMSYSSLIYQEGLRRDVVSLSVIFNPKALAQGSPILGYGKACRARLLVLGPAR